MPEVMVRMAELAVSRTPGDVLASIGLGSCIALALIDRSRGGAGLAHVMLPESAGAEAGDPAKFADTAVPALVERVGALGGMRSRLEGVIVGGAQMFGRAGVLDVGARNEAAARAALARAGLQLVAAETGGGVGRTVRVDVASGGVTVKAAGGRELPLWQPT
jgi:chemotaxis protein CheD